MADIDHEIRIVAPPEEVFAALTNADGLRSWLTSDVTGSGAPGTEWRLGFGERPEFRWRVVASEPERRVVWECTQGPGDAVGTSLTLDLRPTDDGRTRLTSSHAGWPGTHGNFRKCNTIWGVLLHHLKQHVETGSPAPAYS